METDRFDALTARLGQGLTRRRGLGVLAALGAASTMAIEAKAGKHKKKHKKKSKTQPQPCGGACGECQACFNDTCVQVADTTPCGSGQCFDGSCLICPAGKVPAEGLCARPCTGHADCVDGGTCLKMANDNDGNVADNRRFCVITDGEGGATMPRCANGRSTDCRAGMLCIDYATALRCAPPA